MRRSDSNKIWYLTSSVFLHALIVNVFASPAQSLSMNLVSASKAIAVQLDLETEPVKVAANPKTVQKQELIKEKTEPRATESNLRALDQQRAELDQRIKSIREKLKRTVKAQQLKRIAETQKGFQILSAERRGPEWEAYLRQIREQVLEHWYPRLINAEKQLIKSEAQLNFEIFLDGKVKRYEIVNWKGSEEFRRISLEAFKEAMPFQPYLSSQTSRKNSKGYLLTLFFYYQ